MTTKRTPTPWTVSYMVRERKGDYLAAVEELEASHEALVEALEWFTALGDTWIHDYGFSSKAQLEEAQEIVRRGETILAAARKVGLTP